MESQRNTLGAVLERVVGKTPAETFVKGGREGGSGDKHLITQLGKASRQRELQLQSLDTGGQGGCSVVTGRSKVYVDQGAKECCE
jgi:hypothetical protein